MAMSDLDPTVDGRIIEAYRQVKKARAEGQYAAIIVWMRRVDELLDERAAAARADVPERRSA
jgi:hypothetical protein